MDIFVACFLLEVTNCILLLLSATATRIGSFDEGRMKSKSVSIANSATSSTENSVTFSLEGKEHHSLRKQLKAAMDENLV